MSPVSAWTRSDTLIGVVLALGAIVVCLGAILRRPDMNGSSVFLFADPGVNLFLAEKLTNGARLYRDAGFSYGPLAIYPYAWFSSVFGNTPVAYNCFLTLFSAGAVLLSYRVLRRSVSRTPAAAVVIAGLYATLLIPGSLIYGVLSSAYVVIERFLFFLVLLAWRPPSTRSNRLAAATGLLLGVWPGVRFGTAFFLGAAIVVVDLLALYLSRADRAAVTRWLRLGVVTLGCFLLGQGAWIAWAFAMLPAADARDFLWPSYVLDGFAVWPFTERWPSLVNLRLFVGQQLVQVGSAILGLIGLYWIVRDRVRRRGAGLPAYAVQDLVLLLPLCFYGIGAAGLFLSTGHFYQYAWTLPLAAALAIDRGGRAFLVAFLVTALPATVVVLRANLISKPAADWVAVDTPRGPRLLVSPREKARIDRLHELATRPERRTLIIIPVGTGFHTLYGTRYTGRQSFFILGFARGDDPARMFRTLESERSALVLMEYPPSESPGPDPCTWYGFQHFTADVCTQLGRRVDVAGAIQVDETTWLIPGGKPPADG